MPHRQRKYANLKTIQANPKTATKRDDDERLPIHWAVSYNHLAIVELLVSRNDFDPDVQVGDVPKRICYIKAYWYSQDASGWTPLMIASSLRDEDGLVDLLLSKGADVHVKSEWTGIDF